MQDHNFEDQVHRKLDNMQLHPSEDVWNKVEEQIGRKKKRRRFILWLPLLFALFTARYLYFYPLSFAPAKTPALSQPVHPTPQAAGDQVTIMPNNNGQDKNMQRAGREHEKSRNTSTDDMPIVKNNIASDHVFAWQIPVRVSTQHLHHRLAEHTVTGSWYAANKKPVTINDTRNSEPAAVAQLPAPFSETDESASGNDLTLNNDIAIQPAAIHEQITNTAFINTSNSINYRQPFHSLPVIKHVHQARWEWMLTAAYGKSGINNRVFSSWSGVQANAMNNFSSSSGTANAVSNPPPSAVRPGTAFSAGISVRRQLYGRLLWSAGMQYTQLSNHITTGKFVNDTMLISTGNTAVSQMLNQYYTTGAKQPYTNRMHFIELPVELNVRLTGLRQLPVFWNAGFSVSRLIASNALQYHSGAQVYYHNNSLFNRTQWNVSTGFDVQLFTGSRHPLQAGPALSYGVTRLHTSAADDKKHLFFYGVKAALIIPQKVR